MGQWDSLAGSAAAECRTQAESPGRRGFRGSSFQEPATRDLRVEVDVGAELRLYRGMELIPRGEGRL